MWIPCWVPFEVLLVMVKYCATIAYDGTAYSGWQAQPDVQSVQELIEQQLVRLFPEGPRLHCSGRTDRGVHARAQVAHFTAERAIPLFNVQRALNGMLPEDVRIMKLTWAAPDFHARFSAIRKEYRYFIWNGPVMLPSKSRYYFHERRELDVEQMQRAAGLLQGEHDFAAFTANPNRAIETTVRNLMELSVHKNGRDISIHAVGSGFLYKMVRSLAGGLLRVGLGELEPEEIQEILHSKVRTARIPTARPHGLFLWRVDYSR